MTGTNTRSKERVTGDVDGYEGGEAGSMGEGRDAVAFDAELFEIRQLRQVAEGHDGAVLQEEAPHLREVVVRVADAPAGH